MVGPPLLTNPTRVFARLTFTGEDKTTHPLCCDLSRVATIAAANPLPNNLNLYSRNNKMGDSFMGRTLIEATTINSSVENASVASVSVNNTRGSAPTLNGKRPNPFTTEDCGVPAKVLRTDIEKEKRKQIKMENRRQASSLLSENEDLKKQNEVLKNKVRYFQMILQRAENFQVAAAVQQVHEQQNARVVNVTH